MTIAATQAPKHSAQEAILSVLAHIPPGRVSNYGTIAARAGYPGSARHVARILKQLPEDSTIPWHRVVNSQGKISFCESDALYALQINKLKAEGIAFNNNNQISRQFFW